jgi:hypothetical protein
MFWIEGGIGGHFGSELFCGGVETRPIMMGKSWYLPRNGFFVKNIGMILNGWRHKMSSSGNPPIRSFPSG